MIHPSTIEAAEHFDLNPILSLLIPVGRIVPEPGMKILGWDAHARDEKKWFVAVWDKEQARWYTRPGWIFRKPTHGVVLD